MSMKFDNLGAYAPEKDSEAVKGIDVGFPNGIVFTILRAGGANTKYRRAVRKYITPEVDRKIEKGLLTDDEDAELWRNIYADAIVIDLHGAIVDGKEVPYSREVVVALLTASPDMFKDLRATADEMMSFRRKELQETAENLGNASSGKSSGGHTKKG